MSAVETSLASIRAEELQRLLSRDSKRYRHLEALFSSRAVATVALTILRNTFMVSGVVGSIGIVVSSRGVDWPFITLVSFATLATTGALYWAALWSGTRTGGSLVFGVAPLVRSLTWSLTPLLSIVPLTTKSRLKVGGAGSEENTSNPTDIGLHLDADGQPLDEHEVRMIRGVVRLDRTTAREIMVPRVDLTAVEMGIPIKEVVDRMVESGHSRVPVFYESLDDIRGISYARDVLAALSSNTSETVTENTIRPALFIPESKTLEDLLSQFQEESVSVAMVVDEYGGVAGLVTIEDLLEEIVGEISDEFDVGIPEIEEVNPSVMLMDARVTIDDLYDLLDIKLEGDGFDTVGGFVYERLGKIPSTGDTVDYDGITIEVVSTVGRRLKRLRVTRPVQSDT